VKIQILETKHWWMWLCLIGSILSSCNVENSHMPKISQEPVVATLPAENGSWPSAIWQDERVTFTVPAFGLVIDIPGDWLIEPQFDSSSNLATVELSSPCPIFAPDVVSPCTTIRLSFGPSSVQNVEEMQELSRRAEQSSPSSIIIEEHTLDLQGLPAIWSTVANPSISEFSMIRVEVLVDQQVVYLDAYGKLGPVADIVHSIRPIKGISK